MFDPCTTHYQIFLHMDQWVSEKPIDCVKFQTFAVRDSTSKSTGNPLDISP